jgi:hypothetical protein
MSFEHHHLNREVNRNLARARDLRSAYLFACIWAIGAFIARVWRVLRRSHAPDQEMPAVPIGRQAS